VLIKRISISNFQAHKKLNLELDNFTAIVGPSSAGKSSILRALYWLFHGEWDATYPNDPEKETAVAIQLENGTIWARYRKNKSNTATVRRPGVRSNSFRDFGEIIPGILEEINVRPIKIGTAKINLNFSMQDDPIFLVHESKPTKAQWIGRLYGAHIINQMLRIMAKDKRSIESDKKAAEDEEIRLRAELVKYDGLDEKAEALDRVSELLVRLQQLVECQAQMLIIYKDHEYVKNNRHILDIDTDQMRSDAARLVDLKSAQDAISSIWMENQLFEKSKNLLGVDTEQIRTELTRLQDARAILEEYRRLEAEFEETTQQRYKLTSLSEFLLPRLDFLRKDIQDALFKEGRCPLCHSKPKKLDMDAVVSNLKELVRGVK